MTSALIISAIISYLLGSLNFGIIISKSLNKDDVRSHGSGNAGSTNMLRNYGKKHAVMTIIGDMLKVAVAIFISFVIVRKMGNISLAENGGALILLAIFAIIVLITKYVSLGSIAMAVFYPVFIFVFYKSLPLTLLSLIFTLIVVLAHRENIKKLINHTESKIGSKKENN